MWGHVGAALSEDPKAGIQSTFQVLSHVHGKVGAVAAVECRRQCKTQQCALSTTDKEASTEQAARKGTWEVAEEPTLSPASFGVRV